MRFVGQLVQVVASGLVARPVAARPSRQPGHILFDSKLPQGVKLSAVRTLSANISSSLATSLLSLLGCWPMPGGARRRRERRRRRAAANGQAALHAAGCLLRFSASRATAAAGPCLGAARGCWLGSRRRGRGPSACGR